MAKPANTNSQKTWPLPGGIHPPQNKSQSNNTAIKAGPIPNQLIVPVSQHIGAPADILVAVGDKVLKGQCLAEAKGFVSAAVHAPSSGEITSIAFQPVQNPSGIEALCITIATDKQDQWIEHYGFAHYQQEDKSTLLNHIRDSGIVGEGGAGFPSAVKLGVPKDVNIEQLIINAVECEPYITADDRLMRERAEEIIQGVEIIHHLVNPQSVLIGIEDNKPEAIAAMQTAAQHSAINITIVSVPTQYPSGGEKQLIYILTGKEVPSGKLPSSIGVVCQNTGTTYAIKRAVINGEPLISRITTVTGNAAGALGNYETLIGTPVNDLLSFCAKETKASTQASRLIMGGPMMGFSIQNQNVPVVKTTNCIIAADKQEMPEPLPEQPCIRCGHCAEVCPMELLPQQLYWFSKHKELEKAQHYNLMDCIECGACSYECPSQIPLVQYYRFAKGEVRKENEEHKKSDQARMRFEARQQRLDQEEAEKLARKKARKEQAAAKKLAAQSASSNPAASIDVAALKKTSLEASKAYKAAVKLAKAAEAEGAENTEELKQAVAEKKAIADKAKAAVREAGSAAPAAPTVDVAALKKTSLEASKAYKAAVKAAKAAEAEGAENTEELKQTVAEKKSVADKAKAAVREAGPISATAPKAAGADATALTTAEAKARKQFKQAEKAYLSAERNGADNLEQLKGIVTNLQLKLDAAQKALSQAEPQTSATVPDLKSLTVTFALAKTNLKKTIKASDEPPSEEQQKTIDELTALADTAEKAFIEAKAAAAKTKPAKTESSNTTAKQGEDSA